MVYKDAIVLRLKALTSVSGFNRVYLGAQEISNSALLLIVDVKHRVLSIGGVYGAFRSFKLTDQILIFYGP